MAISKNVPLLKNHFRKHWQKRVRVHLDQASNKVRRRRVRTQKALRLAPRPLDSLRPFVRSTTIKYNRKLRLGRGFTRSELKGANLTAAYARTIGISTDHRRQNLSKETYDKNVERLKNYLSKLVIFDKKTKASEISGYKQHSLKECFPLEEHTKDVEVREVKQGAESAYKTLKFAKNEKKIMLNRKRRLKLKEQNEEGKKLK